VILLDVNVLVTAHRADAVGHDPVRNWLEAAVGGHRPVGVASVVASGFGRIVTRRRVFAVPTPLATALEQVADASGTRFPDTRPRSHRSAKSSQCRGPGSIWSARPGATRARAT
jgi:predicted nucleic acid-binding protein